MDYTELAAALLLFGSQAKAARELGIGKESLRKAVFNTKELSRHQQSIVERHFDRLSVKDQRNITNVARFLSIFSIRQIEAFCKYPQWGKGAMRGEKLLGVYKEWHKPTRVAERGPNKGYIPEPEEYEPEEVWDWFDSYDTHGGWTAPLI